MEERTTEMEDIKPVVEKISKRVSISKDNFKKVRIAIETLEINKKEAEAISDVVNKAIEFYYQENIVKQLSGL